MDYASVIDALSANDLLAARNILLGEILASTAGKGSWDSEYYMQEYKEAQQSLVLAPERNTNFTYFGLENFRDRYALRNVAGQVIEDPQMFFARIAIGMARGDKQHAQYLYDIMSKNWFLPSSPTLMNIGTKKGLPISCFLNTVPDDLGGIFDVFRENAFLAKYGGGIGTDWSQLRGMDAPLISSGLKSSGVIPFLKIMDSETIAIARNGVRRGAAAAYLRIDHPDIEDFLEVRKPTGGDQDRKTLNINIGITITDAFMEAVEKGTTYQLIDPHFKKVTKELDAVTMWRKILSMRAESGEPYLLFIDTVNKFIPPHHKEKGLQVRQSNLCTEIVLPTDNDRTAVCCLASINLERWDEFSDQIDDICYAAVKGLDNNLETFLDMADPKEYKKAIFSVKSERSIGFGTMGYHGYLMSKGVPFESLQARNINKAIFTKFGEAARKASVKLGEERGLPLDGGTQRNSYVTSIQPTASTAFLCGEATPAIEPIAGNAYLQKTLSGSFLVKNRHLEAFLETKGQNTSDVWKKVIADKGSVMNLEFLTVEEKAIFRTGYEMNMRELVQQAADRQPYIDQAQSLNLFFQTPVSGKYMHEVHLLAWKLGLKSLYYFRSSAPIQADSISMESQKRDVSTEECAVCQ
ncbi:ribonucleoside-diphosphate reductase subunit alpha [Patescibacteria group bacterium]|nr:ribonucleoside-diphosphate reductase subunit alpha [Patescibacteria group bacterium]